MSAVEPLPDPFLNPSPETYLAYDESQPGRHEFYQGPAGNRIVAMAGASEAHNAITSAAHGSLYAQLRGRGCRLYAADMRVFLPRPGHYVYPDLVALCGQPEIQKERGDTLLNPLLIIEVLSPSTESTDRSDKARAYRRLPSLQEYIFISQRQPHLEGYSRQGDFWAMREVEGLEATYPLQSLPAHLVLAEIYEFVTFED
jgi:Uma2 family endonuclease